VGGTRAPGARRGRSGGEQGAQQGGIPRCFARLAGAEPELRLRGPLRYRRLGAGRTGPGAQGGAPRRPPGSRLDRGTRVGGLLAVRGAAARFRARVRVRRLGQRGPAGCGGIPGAYLPGYRKARIEELLRATPRHTLETFGEIQADLYCSPAHALARRLAELEAPDNIPEGLARELAAWDGHLDAASRPGAVARVALEVLLRRAAPKAARTRWSRAASTPRSRTWSRRPSRGSTTCRRRTCAAPWKRQARS
jgi:hypothetical protein